LSKYKKSLIKPVMQKNRLKKNVKKPILKFGNLGLMFNHEGLVEIKQFLLLKRFLKKKLKRKDKKKKGIKLWSKSKKGVWLYLVPNFIISKKSKNSRMGKGKGSFLKWVFKVKTGFVFLELNKTYPIKVSTIVNKLLRIFKTRMRVIGGSCIETCAFTHSKYKYQIYGESVIL